MDILLENVFLEVNLSNNEINEYSPLVLAYVGDAVFELFIRTKIVLQKKLSVHNLHLNSVQYVKAKAQCEIIKKIKPLLLNEELDIVRRGRNTKTGSVPKNTDISEYRYATGFEALIGFLYLKKDFKRLKEILEMCIQNN